MKESTLFTSYHSKLHREVMAYVMVACIAFFAASCTETNVAPGESITENSTLLASNRINPNILLSDAMFTEAMSSHSAPLPFQIADL